MLCPLGRRRLPPSPPPPFNTMSLRRLATVPFATPTTRRRGAPPYPLPLSDADMPTSPSHQFASRVQPPALSVAFSYFISDFSPRISILTQRLARGIPAQPSTTPPPVTVCTSSLRNSIATIAAVMPCSTPLASGRIRAWELALPVPPVSWESIRPLCTSSLSPLAIPSLTARTPSVSKDARSHPCKAHGCRPPRLQP